MPAGERGGDMGGAGVFQDNIVEPPIRRVA